ncbi:hypothetical protein GTR04_4952 [Trichophyton interdigitale]|uniref:4a-hydroxytetrahydrobiopterin dehydratase n=1 Tax=Trichophyton interdigitale TaxID=101480 RepID=A0A9P5CUU2_9EURO|nr:hypothetical protein GY631_4743 [Trichophyton interdigitale]KAF3892592.1 hypothetical protein GY632_4615 [Trichophyton interdigitale]KAG8207672.1 hypothetical protein GTR04_4952 [Trichophyton interdigitale]
MIASVHRLYMARRLFAQPVSVRSCLFSSTSTPIVAPGVSESQVSDELRVLLKAGWVLDQPRSGIEKSYYFKTYTKCQDFFNTVAIRSKAKNHHSTMIIVNTAVLIVLIIPVMADLLTLCFRKLALSTFTGQPIIPVGSHPSIPSWLDTVTSSQHRLELWTRARARNAILHQHRRFLAS